MTSTERDQVIELAKFPEPDDGATPLLVADGVRAAVAYPAAGAWVIGVFPRCEAFRVTPGAPMRGGHEVRGSDWVSELERSARGGALRHLVFGIGDRTFEFAVPRWNVESAHGRADDVLGSMHASLRHDDVPVLELVDQARGRALPTWLYRAAARDAPLVVFAHGWFGHPRKFKRLFRAWADDGITVAAPTFPLTNDESALELDLEDVVNQPADVSFVIDELLARGIGDRERIGVGGFSLGGETALAAGLHPRHADPRVRAVVAIAGALYHPGLVTDELLPRPLLLVHGNDDRAVRIEEALAVYAKAHEPKELVTFDGAAHNVCEDTGMPYTKEVAERTTAFWNRYLG